MKKVIIFVLSTLFIWGCDSDNGTNNTNNTENNATNNITQNNTNTTNNTNTNNTLLSRSFWMGFSPWMYDATLDARAWTYDHILADGDIISEHMEEGVPWQESYDETEFSDTFTTEITERVYFASGHDLVLQINPMNMARDNLALYRGNTVNEELPEPWNTRGFAEPEVQTAFLNYAIRMVENFTPVYLLIGVEVNLLLTNNPELWDDWVDLNSYVYSNLKVLYPELPIGVSVFCVPYFDQWAPEHDSEMQIAALVDDIEPSVDYVAFSIHPFMSSLLAESFPDNYLSNLFSITSKPIAVSESSYSAQEWSLSDQTIVWYGTPEKQADFAEKLLTESNNYEALYVIWFAIRDYDQLWENVLGSSDSSVIWRDTGLYDENGDPRIALDIWLEWLSREK